MKNIKEYLNECLVNEAYTNLSDLEDIDLLKVHLGGAYDGDYQAFHNQQLDYTLKNKCMLKNIDKDILKASKDKNLVNYMDEVFGDKDQSYLIFGIILGGYTNMAANGGDDIRAAIQKYCDTISQKSSYYAEMISNVQKVLDYMFDETNIFNKYFKKSYDIDRDKLPKEFSGFGSRLQILKRYGWKNKYAAKI